MVSLAPRYGTIGLGLTMIGLAVVMQMPVAQAQVIPDGTLPTIVSSPDNLNFTIDNGRQNGGNLFHSFSQFSVPTGGSAIFNNAADVQTIFSRVTGGNVSNIDGLIQTQGSASLFLLNPNGIVFGPNAALNIGGSFLATTASSIQFADGMEFGTTNPAPLLTMSVPIGLQMGQTPGTIQNAANRPSAFPFAPFIPGGLQVQPGNSVVLLGGDIAFDGGAVSALNGQVEIGAVGANSFVGLVPREFGFELNYDRVQTFQDVRLQGLSALDARDGGVQVRGRQISLLNSPHILTDLVQTSTSRGITLKATESITLSGSTTIELPDGPFEVPVYLSSGIVPGHDGIGGNIPLVAPTITIADGAAVTSAVEMGQGGNILIQADQLNVISGFVYTGVFGSGQGGNILIQTNQLNVLNAGQIGAATEGSGNSGNLTIQAKDVQVSGIKYDGAPVPYNSVLFTTTQGTGNGGTFTLQTDRLRVTDGGILAATTFDKGNAGSLIIQASDFVELAHANKESAYPTGLVADAARSPGRPQILEGNGGNIQVTTGRLIIQDGGAIAVGNPGLGDSGNITINAQSVTLKKGTLDATIADGKKGNININTDVLLLRDGSKISTNAASQANGGDIAINAPIILGLENSDIVANAVQGQGGNIQITTQGIIGLQYRDRLTPENDITASSQFGVNGTVQVNTIGVDPNSGLVALPIDIIDPSQKIAAGCANTQVGSFVITGRGGIPGNPTQTIIADHPWADLRDRQPAPAIVANTARSRSSELTEATTWQLNAQNQPELFASDALPPLPRSRSATCARS
jgi:filamentous hemagglutinin family protein